MKRRAFADEDYWGRPVPGFGPRSARIVVIGLAPGAHGANRTGRVFTGDDSGRLLYGTLHAVGLANRPISIGPGDGLRLRSTYVTGALRCAPPKNAPSAAEIARCRPFLERELVLLHRARVYVALGKIAWDATIRVLSGLGRDVPRPARRFAHNAQIDIDGGSALLLASYHPSRQNTQTGRLTASMFRDVFSRAAAAIR